MTISRRIGLHVINSTSQALGHPTVVKLVDPSLEYYRRVRAEVGPDCLIVVRWYHAVQPLDNPAVNARDWFNAHRAWMQAIPDPDNTVFEGWNEVGDEQAPQYAAFEMARLALLHSIGRRACVGNWSVGCPDLPVWMTYSQMLRGMRSTDVVGLHEYWSDRADLENIWHVRRFTLPAVAAHLQGKQIIITECGRDYTPDTGKGKPGWMLTCSADEYLGDLRRLGELYDDCPNVIGACVFQTGSSDPQWGPFNVWSIWPSVVSEYATDVVAPIPPVIVSPPPIVTPVSIVLAPPIAEADIARNPDGTLRITRHFDPYGTDGTKLPPHFGIDYSCYEGTPVYAVIDGVGYKGDQGTAGFGRYVRIETYDERDVSLYAYAAHLSAWLIGDGDEVQAGDLIGLSGNTGNSTGPHLHFELRRGSRLQASAIDPEPLIVWPQPAAPAAPFLPTNDPIMLARKTPQERYIGIRYWLEERKRQHEAGDEEYADAIDAALIEQMYKWEREA